MFGSKLWQLRNGGLFALEARKRRPSTWLKFSRGRVVLSALGPNRSLKSRQVLKSHFSPEPCTGLRLIYYRSDKEYLPGSPAGRQKALPGPIAVRVRDTTRNETAGGHGQLDLLVQLHRSWMKCFLFFVFVGRFCFICVGGCKKHTCFFCLRPDQWL